MIYFKCKNCGALIKVSAKFAGKKGKCARCGATNDIPLQSEKDAIPKSVEQAAAAPTGAGPAAPLAPGAVPAGLAGAAMEAEPPAPPRPPRRASELPPVAQQIDDLINRLRRRGGGRLFVAAERAAYIGGAYALLGLALLVLLIGVATLVLGRVSFGWTRAGIIEMSLTMVVLALLLPLCQYVIAKIRTAGVKIVQSSPSSVSSTNLLDCIAVLLLVGGVVCLGCGAYMGYQAGGWGQRVMFGLAGLMGAACCFLLAGLAVNPEPLNVQIVPQAGAGSEAVGILSFLCKLILRFAPILLAAVILNSLAELAWATYAAFRVKSVRVLGEAATGACRVLILFTAAYVGVYLLFLLYHLMVDLMRALFEIAVNTRPRERVESAVAAREEKEEEGTETRGRGDAGSGRP